MREDHLEITVTHGDREIWKDITKANLVSYYHAIAPYILPYLKDRPESLLIKPKGAALPGFFMKDIKGTLPEGAKLFTDTRRHKVAGKADQIHYLVCNNEQTLLWMINLGCIDINPWNSRTSSPDQPDFIVIDLDPTVPEGSYQKKPGFIKKLVDTALAVKTWCDQHEITAFAKTSGKTGIHFFIPCIAIGYPEARAFAQYICSEAHTLAPSSSTIEPRIENRDDLVYLDPSQNDHGDTLAAPYSVRPYHIPTVSTPLEWGELSHELNPWAFTIDNTLTRIRKKGDLFAGVLDRKNARANTSRLQKLTNLSP